MILKIIFTIFAAIIIRSSARDNVGTNFVSSYILCEQKPTMVILFDLCWNKKDKISLVNGIMSAGNRVSNIFLENKYQDHDLLFLLDLDCPESEERIQNASSNNLFRAPYRWLILTNSTDSLSRDALQSSSALSDSDVVMAERRGNEFFLVEIHRPSMNLPVVVTPRGVYNGTYHDIRPRRELFRRRMDLMGHPLIMSNVVQDSNQTQYHLPKEDGLDFKNDATTKISWIIGKLAFLMLNATPSYIFSYRYGYKVDGQWSGMIQDLHAGKADLGTNCVFNPERFSVVGYTDTVAPFWVRFIFRQPPLSYASNIFSLPFSARVWAGTGICAAVSALALYAATRWEAMFGKSSTQLDGGISDAMLVTMSALSQQGSALEPRRNSGRITVWSVFATLMALHAAYSANIVTLLQAPSNSITTLSQLAASKIAMAADDVDYTHFIFALYKDPVRVTVYKRIEPVGGKPQFFDLAVGVERVRQGLFAFYGIAEKIYRRVELTFQENEKCDLMEIDFMNAFAPYVPIKKDSPYSELIRVAFKVIRERGIQSGVNRRHQTGKPRCAGRVASFSSVGAAELRPVLALMPIGAALSAAILLLEILTHNLMTRVKDCRKI